MGTPRVSLGCPRTSQPRGVVPWGNIETMESNPWAPISQMAKLRLREADDLPTSGWWRGRLSFSPLLVCPGSLCGLGGGEISPLWAGWGTEAPTASLAVSFPCTVQHLVPFRILPGPWKRSSSYLSCWLALLT